jgi:pyruvate kinase
MLRNGQPAQADLTTLSGLLATMQDLRRAIDAESRITYRRWKPVIQRREFEGSARNLAHYLALRSRDLRPLQTALMPWGLSSLGRIEARVMPNLDAVIATLSALNGHPVTHPSLQQFFKGEQQLHQETARVFGGTTQRRVRIMVTMPTEASTDYPLVRDLLAAGMDCIRINCAHDSAAAWAAMIAHLRQAEQEVGRTAKIAFDLAGPKIRTEHIITPKGERLKIGDRWLLTSDTPQARDDFPFQASCSTPAILRQIALGAPVWFDDGKLGSRVVDVNQEGLVLEVIHASPEGEKLRPDKGLNFPESELHLSPLTPQDKRDLDVIAQHADIISYSFVQDATDMQMLQTELRARLEHPERIAIVAKIETQRAIRNLPEIIIQAAGQQPFGVMIARGDLAVEIGYQRLAEMQEQILWLCEAARVPVIWATQVLENLVKKGRPSRAEMTDAAMAERAECVMLNKGPYIRQAVTILDDVLQRMAAHQSKKTPQLRALKSWPGN